MEIQGRHLLITGASRGIGKAFARVCAEDKAHLYLVSRSFPENFKEELLKSGAASVQLFSVDLSDPQQIKNFIHQTQSLPIDVLFNNAGLLTGGLLENQPVADIQKMLMVNVNAVIELTHAFLPRLLAKKSGKIINHGSVSSIMHFAGASTYSAAKAAVFAFTNSLRAELKGTGVSTLLLLTPGIKTDMFDQIETLYGPHFKWSLASISPQQYAQSLRDAVLHDVEILNPSGFTGAGLKVAQHFPRVFEFVTGRAFNRDPK